MFYIAGNWKMNKNFEESKAFCAKLKTWLKLNKIEKSKVMIFPPALFINQAVKDFTDCEVIVGAQNISTHTQGAYTGEISSSQLKSVNATACIIGHSEQRQYHNETDEKINTKLKKLLADDLICVVCIGESLEQRKAEQTNSVLQKQLEGAFEGIEYNKNIIVAYEPVWAIGTGMAATAEMANSTQEFVKTWLKNKFNADVPVLYGGSVKPANIEELLKQSNIDGGLIGGASLDVDSFTAMIKIANKL